MKVLTGTVSFELRGSFADDVSPDRVSPEIGSGIESAMRCFWLAFFRRDGEPRPDDLPPRRPGPPPDGEPVDDRFICYEQLRQGRLCVIEASEGDEVDFDNAAIGTFTGVGGDAIIEFTELYENPGPPTTVTVPAG